MEDTLFQQFLSSLYHFNSNFSGLKYFGLISFLTVMNGFPSLTMDPMQTRKKTFSVIIVIVAKLEMNSLLKR